MYKNFSISNTVSAFSFSCKYLTSPAKLKKHHQWRMTCRNKKILGFLKGFSFYHLTYSIIVSRERKKNITMEANQDRLFRLPFKLPSSANARTVGVYLSGGLYALGAWLFMDAVIYSKTANASTVHVTFIDWIPFICSTLGMLIVNSIEKNRLLQDALASGSFTGSSSTCLLYTSRCV